METVTIPKREYQKLKAAQKKVDEWEEMKADLDKDLADAKKGIFGR